MSMTLPDLSFRLSYGPSEDRRRPATFPKALGFREGANLRRREGVGGGFARLEAGVAGLAGRPRWRHIRRGGGLQPSRKLRAFGKVPTYDVEKALGVVSPVSKQTLLAAYPPWWRRTRRRQNWRRPATFPKALSFREGTNLLWQSSLYLAAPAYSLFYKACTL